MEMRHDPSELVQRCNVFHKIKQAENEACNRSIGECIFSRCSDSRMGI